MAEAVMRGLLHYDPDRKLPETNVAGKNMARSTKFIIRRLLLFLWQTMARGLTWKEEEAKVLLAKVRKELEGAKLHVYVN